MRTTPQAVKSRRHLGLCEQERTAFLRTARLPELKGQIAATDVAIDALPFVFSALFAYSVVQGLRDSASLERMWPPPCSAQSAWGALAEGEHHPPPAARSGDQEDAAADGTDQAIEEYGV